MNRIILIGNGFDLAHGLKTSYNHFIDDYWKEIIKEVKNKGVPYLDNPEIKISNQLQNGHYFSPITLDWSDIENFETFKQGLANYSVNIDFKNKFFQIISDKKQDQNWVDIENEYYRLLKDSLIKKDKNYSVTDLNRDFQAVKELLREYLKKQSINSLPPVKAGNLKYKIKLDFEPQDFTDIAKRKFDLESIKLDEMLFLNFNYTSTAKQYEDTGLYRKIDNVQTIHIHGTLENPNNDMIFGFGDELDKDYKAIEDLNDNDYLENIKSIKYLETNNYKRMLEFINSGLYQVYIFGHSCGISDRTLLNTLFEHENCCSIKPFYYLKNDGSDNYSDIVKNISRNFNNKAVMRDKVVNKEYCEPLINV